MCADPPDHPLTNHPLAHLWRLPKAWRKTHPRKLDTQTNVSGQYLHEADTKSRPVRKDSAKSTPGARRAQLWAVPMAPCLHPTAQLRHPGAGALARARARAAADVHRAHFQLCSFLIGLVSNARLSMHALRDQGAGSGADNTRSAQQKLADGSKCSPARDVRGLPIVSGESHPSKSRAGSGVSPLSPDADRAARVKCPPRRRKRPPHIEAAGSGPEREEGSCIVLAAASAASLRRSRSRFFMGSTQLGSYVQEGSRTHRGGKPIVKPRERDVSVA